MRDPNTAPQARRGQCARAHTHTHTHTHKHIHKHSAHKETPMHALWPNVGMVCRKRSWTDGARDGPCHVQPTSAGAVKWHESLLQVQAPGMRRSSLPQRPQYALMLITKRGLPLLCGSHGLDTWITKDHPGPSMLYFPSPPPPPGGVQ